MSFEIAFPQTAEEAISASENGARWFAGGTDLIPEIKSELTAPTRLVNLKRVKKRTARDQSAKQAEVNRTKFGRSGTERCSGCCRESGVARSRPGDPGCRERNEGDDNARSERPHRRLPVIWSRKILTSM